MFDDMSSQKRVILAVVLSMMFFIAYGYFFPQPVAQQNTVEKPEQQIVKPTLETVKQIQTNTHSIAEISSNYFTAKINENGEIVSFVLKDERFLNETNEAIDLVDKNTVLYPLSMNFYDSVFNDVYSKTPFKANKTTVKTNEDLILTKEINGITVTKTINFKDNGFYTVNIAFSDNANRDFVITPGQRPDIIADSYTVHGAMIYKNDDTKVDYEDGDIKPRDERTENDSTIAAFSDRYYTTLFYNFQNPFTVYLKSQNDLSVGYVKAQGNTTLNAYIGPKEHKILKEVDEKLINVVEYGWFTFIARPMFAFLNFLHSNINNWGWSIVVLTIIIRILLFPLTYKSMVSMQKLKIIAPKIKEIQEKYKGNPQKMQIHMMELYKKHKANPLGGCLPILIQIPIFFAIYRVLLNAIELKAAPWALWITDLAVKDPFYVLPIYMGATMFLQQVITPMTIQDPTQAKIMKFLPLVFVFFFLTFPAGLTLYWCVNNTFSLAQQWFINKIFANKEAKNENS